MYLHNKHIELLSSRVELYSKLNDNEGWYISNTNEFNLVGNKNLSLKFLVNTTRKSYIYCYILDTKTEVTLGIIKIETKTKEFLIHYTIINLFRLLHSKSHYKYMDILEYFSRLYSNSINVSIDSDSSFHLHSKSFSLTLKNTDKLLPIETISVTHDLKNTVELFNMKLIR